MDFKRRPSKLLNNSWKILKTSLKYWQVHTKITIEQSQISFDAWKYRLWSKFDMMLSKGESKLKCIGMIESRFSDSISLRIK